MVCIHSIDKWSYKSYMSGSIMRKYVWNLQKSNNSDKLIQYEQTFLNPHIDYILEGLLDGWEERDW